MSSVGDCTVHVPLALYSFGLPAIGPVVTSDPAPEWPIRIPSAGDVKPMSSVTDFPDDVL